ncbi:MAG: hypothetical protein PUP90_31140 [Nostoc sp. S4]|nr:hypothetical protein [Nostoc sp. S4]
MMFYSFGFTSCIPVLNPCFNPSKAFGKDALLKLYTLFARCPDPLNPERNLTTASVITLHQR